MATIATVWEFIDLPLAIFILLNVLLLSASGLVYAERVVSAFIQERTGPDRVGPRGILQPFADVFKLLFKEDIVPTNANGFIHSLAPTLMGSTLYVQGLLVDATPGASVPLGLTGAVEALLGT